MIEILGKLNVRSRTTCSCDHVHACIMCAHAGSAKMYAQSRTSHFFDDCVCSLQDKFPRDHAREQLGTGVVLPCRDKNDEGAAVYWFPGRGHHHAKSIASSAFGFDAYSLVKLMP
jgi:hypothetical protein